MSGRRLTIGLTINLGHYENLRVEVEGEPGEGHDEIRSLLDEVLSSFGRDDPPTAALIDHYRKRVLGLPEQEEGTGEAKTDTEERYEIPGLMPPGSFDLDDLPGDEAVEPGFTLDEEAGRTDEAGDGVYRAAPGLEGPAQVFPGGVDEGEESGPGYGFTTFPAGTVVCEACGVPVSPAEEKLSKLFASRVLCRTCLKKIQ
jgi:hypothetical protein